MTKQYRKGENFKSMKEFNEYFESNGGYYYNSIAAKQSGYPALSYGTVKTGHFKLYAPAIEIKEEKLFRVLYKRKDNFCPQFAEYLYESKEEFVDCDSALSLFDYEWIKLKQVNLDEWS